MYRVTDEGIQKRISQDRVYIFDNGKIDMRLFNTKYILSGRCTQLAKRYIFDYLRFPTNMTLAEDLFLLPDILSQTRKIIYTTKGLYYYYRRKNSACSVFSEFKARNDIDAKKKYFLFLKNNGAYSNIALKWLVDAYAIGYKYLETKDLKKEYNSFFLQNLTNSCFSIKCILFFISPNLYLLIQKYRFNCVRY